MSFRRASHQAPKQNMGASVWPCRALVLLLYPPVIMFAALFLSCLCGQKSAIFWDLKGTFGQNEAGAGL